MSAKYVFVTGGVTSSLGKGIISASLAKLLQARNLRVTIQKFDPYINVDPGTLNPYEHGECYVTEDGAEADLDLGHYERFLNIHTSKSNTTTTGKIYRTVIDKEREGAYMGKTVQVVPHIIDEIKRRMLLLGKSGKYDVVITEIGGTVGDIESLPYVEAVRQLQWELPDGDVLLVHLTLVPYLSAAKELKTKPTQHSVKLLQQNGLQPDVIVCRTEHHISAEAKRKVALFCNVRPNAVIESMDAKTIYEVPLLMREEKLDEVVIEQLNLKGLPEPNLEKWEAFIQRLNAPKSTINIALVGKYVELQDAYKSIQESFIHAGAVNECKVKVTSVQSEHLTFDNVAEKLGGMDGILVASGFGERGVEGKAVAANYARENKIPYFGIGLGMQMGVVDFARSVMGLKNAKSTELDPNTDCPIIDLMADHKTVTIKGGTMRLGGFLCKIKEGTLAHKIYGKSEVVERHHHRYEVNNEYIPKLEEAGMVISGVNPDTDLVEIVEIPSHPFYIGVQFLPDFKSTPENPHPLFVAFVKASIENKK